MFLLLILFKIIFKPKSAYSFKFGKNITGDKEKTICKMYYNKVKVNTLLSSKTLIW